MKQWTNSWHNDLKQWFVLLVGAPGIKTLNYMVWTVLSVVFVRGTQMQTKWQKNSKFVAKAEVVILQSGSCSSWSRKLLVGWERGNWDMVKWDNMSVLIILYITNIIFLLLHSTKIASVRIWGILSFYFVVFSNKFFYMNDSRVSVNVSEAVGVIFNHNISQLHIFHFLGATEGHWGGHRD